MALVAACGAVASGCGDPARSGYYQGDRIFAIECLADFEPIATKPLTSLTVGVVWLVPRGDGGVDGVSADIVDDGIYPTARISLFTPPPAAALREGTLGRYALGQVIYFDDLDQDGDWQASEPLFGVSRGRVIVFAPEAVTAPQFGALPAGFHVLVPDDCRDGAVTRGFVREDPLGCGVQDPFDPEAPLFTFECRQ